MNLGEIVRKHRKEKGITQLELSNKLGFDSSQFVSLFERNLSKVPLNVMNQCCDILGIKKEQIIKGLVKSYESKIREEIK